MDHALREVGTQHGCDVVQRDGIPISLTMPEVKQAGSAMKRQVEDPVSFRPSPPGEVVLEFGLGGRVAMNDVKLAIRPLIQKLEERSHGRGAVVVAVPVPLDAEEAGHTAARSRRRSARTERPARFSVG
jgi:hypothetical protein